MKSEFKRGKREYKKTHCLLRQSTFLTTTGEYVPDTVLGYLKYEKRTIDENDICPTNRFNVLSHIERTNSFAGDPLPLAEKRMAENISTVTTHIGTATIPLKKSWIGLLGASSGVVSSIAAIHAEKIDIRQPLVMYDFKEKFPVPAIVPNASSIGH